MKKHQEFGGFVLDANYALLDVASKTHFQQLLKNLSHFDITYIIQNESDHVDPNNLSPLHVIFNLVQRGLPTRMSFRLEKQFNQAFNNLELVDYLGGISYSYKETPPEFRVLLERAVHIIDPRVQASHLEEDYKYSWEQLDSQFEKDFYFNTLGNIKGKTSWLLQLVECQRPLTEIVNVPIMNKVLETNFIEQRCDFSLEFPYLIQGKSGVILEVDGSQHNSKSQKKLDNARDEAVRESNWFNTIRIPTQDWSNQRVLLSDLQSILQDQYFAKVNQNYHSPLYSSSEGLVALQLALSPILIARVQKMLLRQIIDGKLDSKKKRWKICIIERDVPGGSLAIRDLEDSLTQYLSLIEEDIQIPTIDVQIYSSPEFIDGQLHDESLDNPTPISELSKSDIKFDLVIDISILSRIHAWPVHHFKRSASNYVVITSSKSVKEKRQFRTGKLLQFKHLTSKAENGDYIENETLRTTLEIFLVDIFRKKSFRPGQLPIMDRVLRQESVIGLLPTGGGKSMTYQLSTFMQPGITLIVDPIKSLMRDQVKSLTINLLDCAGYVNSSLNRAQKEVEHERLITGELLFFFVSPERLLIQDFRDILGNVRNNNIFFSYCVIDEAHCVSEWGHDFRTSYLFLGRNASRCAQTFSQEPITLFGLTATASYDVLADIQRELSGDTENLDSILSDDAIVRFETFNRQELQYQVMAVNLSNDKPYRDIWELKQSIGVAKHAAINDLLSVIPRQIEKLNNSTDSVYIPITDIEVSGEDKDRIAQEIALADYDGDNFWKLDNEHAGIIFCPHRSWYFGVTDKYKNGKKSSSLGVTEAILSAHQESNIQAGTFLGVDQDAVNHTDVESDNQNNQDAFINSDINLMVCTKAFGMGIDKANVRLAIHLNYPQSIESYVQEAGRIGRDGKIAISCIAYNNQAFNLTSNPDDNSVNIDRQILMDFYNSSFPGKNKEKWNLFELLSGIETPPSGVTGQIEAALLEEEQLELRVGLGKDKEGKINKLRVSSPDNMKYGILFLPNLHPATNFSDFPHEQAKTVLGKVKNAVRTICPKNTDALKWFSQITPGKNEPGIEAQLFEMNYGEKRQIIIFFTNDISAYQKKVLDVLSRTQGHRAKKLFKEYRNTSSIEVYTEAIPDLSDYNRSEIKKSYYKTRSKHDTEKALYRLALVGVVTDFTTDYRYKTFTVTIHKRSDEEYSHILRSYIRRYYSETRTQKILGEILTRDGNTYIQKALGYIIEFLYREIAHKRKKSIDAIQEACEIGANRGNWAMKEYIDVYFNSKYGRAGFEYEAKGELINGSLLDRTEEGREAKIQFIWEFINIATVQDLSGAQLVNLKHLRGACVRLLINNPNNFSLLLLKAFCTIVLEEERIHNSTLIDEARVEIQTSFDLLLQQEEIRMVKLMDAINQYFGLLKDNISRNEMLEIIDQTNELQLAHSNRIWLQTFNNNFMVEYE
jgi:superfamily II DNA helicase RecQ